MLSRKTGRRDPLNYGHLSLQQQMRSIDFIQKLVDCRIGRGNEEVKVKAIFNTPITFSNFITDQRIKQIKYTV